MASKPITKARDFRILLRRDMRREGIKRPIAILRARMLAGNDKNYFRLWLKSIKSAEVIGW